MNYFKPIWEQELEAEGFVVRRTTGIVYAECEITDEGGRLVAKLSSSCMILQGEAARGR